MKDIRFIVLGLLVVSLFSCTNEGRTDPVDSEDNEPVPPDSLKWQQIRSVKDLHAAYPDQLQLVFENIDLQRDGLEQVKQAWENGDTVAAGKRLLEYYKESEIKSLVARESLQRLNKTWFPDWEISAICSGSKAETIIQDIITIQGITAQVPRLANGHLDWDYTGPNDDRSFAGMFNRHICTVDPLLEAWFDTGNPTYARYIDTFIKDWIINSWPYPGVKNSTRRWRGLEVMSRVKRWMPAFYNLLDTGYLSPATQLLMLSSLPEHAHYLRNFHAGKGHNWVTMEMSGLATVGGFWPEFKNSSGWFDYAVSTMTESMDKQVYPDGVQTELTSHYHRVPLKNFSKLADIANLANAPLPDSYTNRLEKMWHYLAATMRPDGHGPLNNDGDLNYIRGDIKEAAETINRPDWEYIASNGDSGTKPDRSSFLFPWAGQLISRSDFGADGHWSFFDIGPWGSSPSHRHNDKLHLAVAAFGHDLLVDAGRFAYHGEVADRFRAYAKGSCSHNVVLIDGTGQDGGPGRTDEPIPPGSYKITDAFDYASGSFDNFDVDGQAAHIRSLLYVRGKFWVVADRITTDRPREIETLWHWHPEVSVQKQENGVIETHNQRGNLKIIPAGATNWSIDFVKGQDKPVVQGWYSEEYNTYEANTTTIYRGQITSDSTFVWVLVPSEGVGPEVKTEILSQEADAVNLRVSIPGEGSWKVSVPFVNSAEAGVEGP